jgi:hypothetical protein
MSSKSQSIIKLRVVLDELAVPGFLASPDCGISELGICLRQEIDGRRLRQASLTDHHSLYSPANIMACHIKKSYPETLTQSY